MYIQGRVKKLVTFKGGVHLEELKYYTEKKPIEDMPAPKIVVIPFSQHTGASATPLVEPKTKVKIGTKIGEASGNVSVPVHSSVSGVVKAITLYHHPVFPRPSLACVIENDGKEELDESIKERKDYKSLGKEELLKIIKDAGIVGLGGAAFPTHVKLMPPPEYPVNTLILNGCECEPYLTADDRLMQENPEGIVEGAQILAKILEVKNVIFAIESNKPRAIEKLKETIESYKFGRCEVVKTKYPQGAEKQLIKAILRREVPIGGLPFMVGVVVQNVGTAYAVYEAVRKNKPLYERVITVTGKGIKEPKNLRVRIGTLARDVIEFVGGYTQNPAKLIFGGPMMGIAQSTDEVPIIKGTSGLVVLPQNEAKVYPELCCIRCGNCVDVCPMRLVPTEIMKFCQKDRFDDAEKRGILNCIECGSCGFVCPLHIRIVQWIKYGKTKVAEKRAQ